MPSAPLVPGVWGVLATPFTGSALTVDRGSLGALAGHYQDAGAAGLTVLGVFGEAAQLNAAERRTVLETVTEATSLPLVAGATALDTAAVVAETRLAQQVTGDRLAGMMIQVNSSDAQALTRHLRAVHERTGVGIVVQDYPLASGVHITPQALGEALRALPFVIAVKAEAPPTPPAVAALTRMLDVPVFGGLGGIGLLDELACGAAGAMTGFSFPEGLIACVQAWEAGGYRQAREAFLPYLPLVNFEQQAGIGLAVRKECLRWRKLIGESGVRAPVAAFPPLLQEQLEQHLDAVPKLQEVRR